MVEIDIKKIKNVISDYNDIIEELEEDNTILINKFNELQNYWNDQNRIKLSTNFKYEKQRILNLENNIKEQQKVYKTIESNYEKIGNKIKCNLDNQDLLNNKIDIVIDKISSIINEYNNLGDISFYSKSYLIYNQKDNMKDSLSILKKLKTELNNKLSQIRDIEQQISELLSTIKVENIIANNYESED